MQVISKKPTLYCHENVNIYFPACRDAARLSEPVTPLCEKGPENLPAPGRTALP